MSITTSSIGLWIPLLLSLGISILTLIWAYYYPQIRCHHLNTAVVRLWLGLSSSIDIFHLLIIYFVYMSSPRKSVMYSILTCHCRKPMGYGSTLPQSSSRCCSGCCQRLFKCIFLVFVTTTNYLSFIFGLYIVNTSNIRIISTSPTPTMWTATTYTSFSNVSWYETMDVMCIAPITVQIGHSLLQLLAITFLVVINCTLYFNFNTLPSNPTTTITEITKGSGISNVMSATHSSVPTPQGRRVPIKNIGTIGHSEYSAFRSI